MTFCVKCENQFFPEEESFTRYPWCGCTDEEALAEKLKRVGRDPALSLSDNVSGVAGARLGRQGWRYLGGHNWQAVRVDNDD